MKYSLILLIVFALGSAASAQVWEPVVPAELDMKKPVVEPNADAEVLFWEVRIADEVVPRAGWKSIINHHVRVKIFTERGRESNSKIDIPFGNVFERDSKVLVKDITARTIKPDGSIIELKPEEVFERDIVKVDGAKLKAKSFAVPGVQVGAIVEYRWREIRNAVFNYTRLEMSRDIPVQYVKYSIRPAPNVPLGLRLHSVNTSGGFTQETGGFYATTMRNVAAFKEEPRMPSEYDVRPWVLVYYGAEREDQSVESYWRDTGKSIFDYYKDLTKPSGDIKAAALKAVGDAVEPLEKVRRIFDFCRRSVKNVYDDAYGYSSDQLEQVKLNKTPTEALKRGTGYSDDIDELFASMLMAVGIDARFASVASRTDSTFNRTFANDYFIRHGLVAVRLPDGWKFLKPSERHLPFGMVSWAHEGQAVLISDSDRPFWEQVPVSAASESGMKRTSKLALTADGSLEGEVRMEFFGHLAQFYREFDDDDSQMERERSLTERMKRDIGNSAEVSSIMIENLDDSSKPYVYSFKLRVPSYTERTGKRMFLRPNVFKRNTTPVFSSSKREYDISFPYMWTETDEIDWILPPGFVAEKPESPKPLRIDIFGGTYNADAGVSEDAKKLTYRRNYSFGKADSLRIKESLYGAVKNYFDAIHLADSQNVILREQSAGND